MAMSYEAKQQFDDIQDLLELCDVDMADAMDIMAKAERLYELGYHEAEKKLAPKPSD